MLPLSEVRVLDRNAEALGMSLDQLVENAGAAIADAVGTAHPVVVLAGPGNNGADGLAAARRLGATVLAPFGPDGWKSAPARALAATVSVEYAPRIEQVEAACSQAAVVVDALIGAGITRELRAPYDSWVRVLDGCRARVLAVDLPTGFGTPTSYVPARTLTFHQQKVGMTRANSGDIIVASIGIPDDASLYTGPGEYALYPAGRKDQHKGEGGIVLVIGGGPYTGAPAVAGLAALRAGADLAIILTPERAWQTIASYSPNLIVRPLNGADLNMEDPANRVTLNSWIKRSKSIVLGPGLGLMAQAQKSVHHVLQRAAQENVPVVIDADALSSLAERKDLLSTKTVLTPHAREFKTLTGRTLPSDPIERGAIAQEAAKKHGGGAWLLKGPVDVIADPTRVKLNATGHPAMSVGGTGDALAGVVGALLAKGLDPFDAARLGARLTGEAGERAAATKSWGLLATDVVDALPDVLRERIGTDAR